MRSILTAYEQDAGLPAPEVHAEIDSTNRRARELAAMGAPHGTAVIALTQTAGRGRLARTFSSAYGGLYISVILRAPISITEVPLITPFAAVATAKTIEAHRTELSLALKWVNDVYLDGRKLSGILVETALAPEGNRLSYAVVGVGINVTNRLPKELREIAISLQEVTKPPSIAQLAVCLTRSLMCMERALTERIFMKEYRRRSFLIGRTVTVYGAGTPYEALVLAIGDDAALVVQKENGEIVSLSSGEVSIRQTENCR